MAGEVSWEDVGDVKEIIADIRDPDCEMRWVIFGYASKDMKKLSVVDAGDGGLEEVVKQLKNTRVMFAFLQLEEKKFAFFQWCPEGASGMEKARASIHRSFITSYLGALAVDVHAEKLEDLSQSQIDEEFSYSQKTTGRDLDQAEAKTKLAEADKRKQEMQHRERTLGNTYEAQKQLAKLSATGSSKSLGSVHLQQVSGTNVTKRAPAKSLSHTMYAQAQIEVEFEEEDVLKELILDLREAEVGGDFDWLILGYAEDRKAALELVETGNGGREGIVDYLRESMGGALDRVLYVLIKEDDTTSKCTFVYWIGSAVPAFRKASTSTHRGAISAWVTKIVHNLQEEYVGSGNDLLGLKEEEAEPDASVLPGGEEVAAVNATLNESMLMLESRMQSKPGTGKVLDDVVRHKTPHELWLERKQHPAAARLPSAARDALDSSAAPAPDPEFKQVTLKSKGQGDGGKRKAGRSKYAQQLTEEKRQSAEGAVRRSDSFSADGDARRDSAPRDLDAATQAVADVVGEVLDWSPDPSDQSRSPPPMAEEGSASPNRLPEDQGREEEERRRARELEEEKERERAEELKERERRAAEEEKRQRKQAEEQRLREEEEEEAAERERVAERKKAEEEERRRAEEDERERQEEESRRRAEQEERARKEEEEAAEARRIETEHREEEARIKEEAAREEKESKAREERIERERREEQERLEAERVKEQEERKEEEAKQRAEAERREEALRREQARAEEEERRKEEALRAEEERKRRAREEEEARLAELARKRDEERRRRNEEEEEVLIRADDASAPHPGSMESAGGRIESRLLNGSSKALDDGPCPAAGPAAGSPAEEGTRKDVEPPTRGANGSGGSSAARAGADLAAKKAALAEGEGSKRAEEDEIRKKAEELLARKKALLEEAARRHHRGGVENRKPPDSSALAANGPRALPGDADRLKRAEEYRQRKMAELASKKGDDAAAKKAAFLREAEEAVRRAAQQDANRRKPVQAMALSSEDSTPPITPPISPIKR